HRGGRGRRGSTVLRPLADDLVPAEVPPVVVRLEPGTAAVHQPGRNLPRTDGRPVPLHRRPPVGAPRLPLPGRRPRPEPVAAPGEVAAAHPPLLLVVLPRPPPPRGGVRRWFRLFFPRPPPGGFVRLRGGSPPRNRRGRCFRPPPHPRPVPAVPAGTMTG